MHRLTIHRTVWLALSVAGALALPAWATDNVWTDQGGDDSAGNPANWSLGHIPNMSENAIITSGTQIILSNNQNLVATTIQCTIPMYINAGYVFCTTFNTSSTLSTYNNAQIYLASTMQVNGTWNVFGTTVGWWQAGANPTVTIGPSAHVVLNSGGMYLQDALVNQGVITGQGQTISFGSAQISIEFLNSNTGVIADTSIVNDGLLTPYVFNQGTMSWTGGAPHLTVFGNEGIVDLRGAQLTIDDLLDLDGDTSLDFGYWALRDSSTITHNNCGDISALGGSATVRFEGGTNFFGGLERMTSIAGRLEIYGTTMQLVPPFFGHVDLSGFLRMEDGGRIEVLGGFWITSGDAVLDKVVAQPSDNDVIVTDAASLVGGQLIVELQNQQSATAGTTIRLMQDTDNCCDIGGTFASVDVFGTNNPTFVDYQQHLVRVLVSSNVVGDMNCDGVVNFNDINPFVLALTGQAAYNVQYPNCNWLNADCNADGSVNFADIDPFVALLGG